MPYEVRLLEAQAVTKPPGHHFFGYYDVTPWDPSGRWMVGLEVDFIHRPPRPDDVARIGLIDTWAGFRWRQVAETYAWNWQMGCRLQWLPGADGLIIFNARREGRYVAVIMDPFRGEEVGQLPMPIYSISPDGRWAVTLNFSRVARTRPGYGYVGVPDSWENEAAPDEDGIWLVDMQSGESELIISLGQMARFEPRPDFEGAVHWFNHLLFAPEGDRFIFLHRWGEAGRAWKTRLFTARQDGTDICLLADDDLVSHFDWRDGRTILAWARVAGMGDHFFLFRDCAGTGAAGGPEAVGADVLDADGHCSYSPDRRWILTDKYPDAHRMRRLILYRVADNAAFEVGRFYAPAPLQGEIRCDLHPRWSRDGRMVCVDSAHEGTRQMYVVDVGEIVQGG